MPATDNSVHAQYSNCLEELLQLEGLTESEVIQATNVLPDGMKRTTFITLERAYSFGMVMFKILCFNFTPWKGFFVIFRKLGFLFTNLLTVFCKWDCHVIISGMPQLFEIWNP